MSRGRHASDSHPAPPPFLNKTYELVDDASTNDIVSWSAEGASFVVWKPAEFAAQLLPRHFKHNNFSSFVRQLNTYGFRKVDPDRWEFSNDCFVRGHKELLHEIHRRKNTGAASHSQTQLPTSTAIEVGSYGSLADEVETLKRDKNVLMLELVRLRQHQQNSDAEMRSLHSRLEGTEQRQQQLMSFLAKALQSPQFLQQVLAARTPSRLTAGRKKRRAARYDGESEASSRDEAEQAVDNSAALVQWQQPAPEFAAHLAQLLQAEPPAPAPAPWGADQPAGGRPGGVSGVDAAFHSMNLAGSGAGGGVTIKDESALGRAPEVPGGGAAGPMPSITEEGGSPPAPQQPGFMPTPGPSDGLLPNGAAGPTAQPGGEPDWGAGAAGAAGPMSFSPDEYLDLGLDLGRLASQELMSLDGLPDGFWQALQPADGAGAAAGLGGPLPGSAVPVPGPSKGGA